MDWFTAVHKQISNNPYTSFGFVMSLNDYRGLDVHTAKLFLIPTGKLMVPAGSSWFLLVVPAGRLCGSCCSLIPLSHGIFDVIVGMDWLSKRKLVIVCHEKVVRIPLEGDGILRVQGERTLVAAKALMNDKIYEPRISDIPVVRDFTEVFPEDLLGLPSQRQVEFRIDLVPGATPVAKSPYCLAPSEMQ
ncbi:hypothetical protein Tco_0407944 [Tanacetum coccineum]